MLSEHAVEMRHYFTIDEIAISYLSKQISIIHNKELKYSL
jgi:hypothetical protein